LMHSGVLYYFTGVIEVSSECLVGV
jgi:hypothetical protein